MFYTRINLVFTSIMNKFGINSNRWEHKLDKATCQSIASGILVADTFKIQWHKRKIKRGTSMKFNNSIMIGTAHMKKNCKL